jgi:GNAT superfamily N-acetyltransferase
MFEAVIRLLTHEDLEEAFTLSSAAGWNQRLADWRMLLALAPRGSFAALSEGRIVGTAMGIDYGGFAWIAMMLVDPAYRGRGLGRRLLEAAMASVPSDRSIRLDATPMGRPLYRAYGFEDDVMLTRYVVDRHGAEGSAPLLTSHPRTFAPRNSRPMTPADLPIVTDQDAGIFGGNRRAVLDWALAGAPQYAHVVPAGSGLVHYCLGRQGRLFDQIGPVVAGDDEMARALVTAALTAAAGRPVALDVFDAHSAFVAWLATCGLRAQRPLYRMRRPPDRENPSSGERRPSPLVEFAILGPEFA